MHFISLAIALIPYFHLVRFVASSTSNPILFTLSSTCLLHVCFGLPHFRCSFTASINVFFRTLSYSLLTICPYHLTPFFAFAILFNVFFKPSISINFSFSDYAFYPPISQHRFISPWPFPFFLRLPSQFPSNIICILCGNDESINLFHDAKAPGEAVKDQMVTLVYRTQMQQLTIHKQKGKKKNKIIPSLHDDTTSIRLLSYRSI